MERKKVISIISISLIFLAGVVVLNLTIESTSTYLAMNDINRDLNEYLQSYDWYDESSDYYSNDVMHITCQQLLSRQDVSLDTRYFIAKFLSTLLKTDLPILFLAASEIARSYSCSIKQLHQGYLITNDHWVMLLEHGFSLLLSE